MSTLWTPEGEHRVPPTNPADRQMSQAAGPGQAAEPGQAGGSDHEAANAAASEAFDVDPVTGLPIDPRTGEPFDPEEVAELEAQLREAQEQLVSVPSAEIVQNHMMGLFELAALHLRREPPDLEQAK